MFIYWESLKTLSFSKCFLNHKNLMACAESNMANRWQVWYVAFDQLQKNVRLCFLLLQKPGYSTFLLAMYLFIPETMNFVVTIISL